MAELKISDLSVGDWVLNRKGFPTKVQVITSEGNMRCGEDAKPEHSVHIWITDVSPIPITPEILEKNGLEYVDDDNDAVIFLCCDMFWARLCVGDTFWQVGIHSEDRNDAVVCDVKHTHQLQHALRLAGIEKEIEV